MEAYSIYDRVTHFFPAGMVADRQMLDAHVGERERTFLERLANLLTDSHVTISEHPGTRLMEVHFHEIGYFEERVVTLPWWPNKLDGWRLKEALEANYDAVPDDPFSYQTKVMNEKRLLDPQLGERERDFLLRLASLLEEEKVTIAENPGSRLIEVKFYDDSSYEDSLVTLPDWPKKLDPWKLKTVLTPPSPTDNAPSLGGDVLGSAPRLPSTPDELRTYYWGFGYGIQGREGEGQAPSIGQLVRLLLGSQVAWGPQHREAIARVGAGLIAAGVTQQLLWEPALVVELAGAGGLATKEVRELLYGEYPESWDRVIDVIYKDARKLHEQGEGGDQDCPNQPQGLEPTLGDQRP